MRTTVERRARAGFAARKPSTARISVVLPEPEEPIIRMLPTLRRASFFESAIDISRTASFWPMTRFSSAAAIWAADGGRAQGDSTPPAPALPCASMTVSPNRRSPS